MDNLPIVITDDDDNDSSMLANAIQRVWGAGKMIFMLSSGQQLLDLLSDMVLLPELIIIDMIMPKLTAADLLPKLKGIKQLNAVPIIVVSDDKFNLEAAYKLGISGFYSKPNSIEGFVEIAQDIKRNYCP